MSVKCQIAHFSGRIGAKTPQIATNVIDGLLEKFRRFFNCIEINCRETQREHAQA